MKKSFKYSLLITLTLLIITSLVNAQPVPIGKAEQDRPYESNPTTVTGNAPGSGAERDGSLSSSWAMQGPATAGSGTAFISGFTIPPPAQQFPIGWVDLKIKYKHPGIGDDGYHMAYKTSGTMYAWLQTAVSGAAAKFDRNGIGQVRPWVNLAPTSGTWNWTQVQNLMVRIIVTRGANAVWDTFLDVYEVWVTVYEHAPPSSSAAMSVMPGTSNISIVGIPPGKYFFVDVYANGLPGSPGLWGYQATIKYDESIVTAHSWFTYWPFVTAAPSAIGVGNVSVAYYTFNGDLVGFTGVATPLCRIYFQVDKGGATPLDLIDDKSLWPPLISEFKQVGVAAYTPPLYDGWLSSPLYLSAQPPTLIDLTNPISTVWHEDYSDWGKLWHLSSWEDVSPLNPGELGPSDQIGMTNETWWLYWFHVENVTITIHYTFKDEFNDTTEEIGVAEPEVPMLTMPPGSPVGTWWHMIYPTYCQWFTITSWVDSNSDGDFSPSDQFDFSSGVSDVLLAGTAPAVGSPLSGHAIGGQQIMYVDSDYSGTWSPGEPGFDDVDWDGMYVSYYDTHLVGPAIADWTGGSYPGALDTFHDADYSYWWDPGEPAIRDVNSNGIYDVATTFWAHLDNVSTNIIVSQKPYTILPSVFEFPFGVNLLLLVAPIIPLTYLWRLRKKMRKQ